MMKILFSLFGLIFTFICTNNSTAQSFGKSLKFNGNQDYVLVPDHNVLDIVNSTTIEVYIQAELVDTMMIFMKGWCNPSDYSYYLLVTNGYLKWVFDADGYCSVPSLFVSDSPIIINGECAHFTIVNTNSYVKIYKNGVPVPGSLISGSYGPIYNSSQPLILGAYRYHAGNYGMFYQGTIDELRFWNYERTQSQIFNGKNSPLIGNESGLVAYYNMEDLGIGNSITLTNKATITGNSINGTTYGTATTPYFINSCAIALDANDYSAVENVIIHPNPTFNQLTIDTEIDIKKISILDVTGKIIMYSNIETSKINVEDLSQGIYFLKLMTVEGIIIRKFVKN